MAERTEQVTKSRQRDIDGSGETIETNRVTRTADTEASSTTVAANVVYLVYGVVAGLLGIRFVLSLLAANRTNAFADMVYSVTGPLVAPFRSLFSVDTTVGSGLARFEIETPVAIGVYGLIAWLLLRIIMIKRP